MANIIIPKQKILIPVNMPAMRASIAAYIEIEKAKCDSEGNELPGTRRVVVPKFKNTVTNVGMNRRGHNNGIYADCVLGTGISPILESSTNLGNLLGVHDSKVGDGWSTGSPFGLVTATTPYYGWKRGTYRFNAGNCTGVLSEVGLTAQNYSTSPSIAMGSLIKDNLGNPTTITKDVDELLDISYEVRLYVKMTDDTYVVNINGVDHTFTTRAEATGAEFWGQKVFGANFDGLPGLQVAYEGATLANIGSILQGLLGTTANANIHQYGDNTMTQLAYVTDTFFRECHWQIGPTTANFTNGITGLRNHTGVGMFKTVISPAIPKVLGSNLLLKARAYWDRYNI